MKEKTLKRFSIGFMISLLTIAIVWLIVVVLLSAWNSMPQPVTYVVVDVIRNTEEELPDCDQSMITVLQNVVTESIVYKCGNIGKISEIVTIPE